MPPKTKFRRDFRGRRKSTGPRKPMRIIPLVGQQARHENWLSSMGLKVLPLLREVNSCLPNNPLRSTMDVIFDYIRNKLSDREYDIGVYAMFGLNPASMLVNSPLLAPTPNGTSFPGHPVSVKRIEVTIHNTTPGSERSGRWAAVLIPYIEAHDASHYAAKMKDLTFIEVAAMPHSRVNTADKDIRLSYRMRDKVAYCARPREIAEEIACVFIIWDTCDGSKMVNPNGSANIQPSQFKCDISITGLCRPHVIFGPKHRVTYDDTTFDINKKTVGGVRLHHPDGRIEHLPYDDGSSVKVDEFEMLHV